MCQENQEEFFDRLITHDETWIHHYYPETKAQSKQWKHYDSPPPKKARVQPSVGKVMLTVFWDQRRVVMDFLAKGTTITGTYYASLLQKLWEAIKTKRRQKGSASCKTTSWFTMCMLARQKHGPAAMKFFLTPLTLLTLHHLTSTFFQS
ncbi:histone-lysine N-methyltransferase SETMAR-like [Scylla paramamosain]|uniref:histone-lysine N-methyltransferase SETMAR-like n=1 Tax=Scylla paramamosain TaxID=85552 RepID=UPI00308335E1